MNIYIYTYYTNSIGYNYIYHISIYPASPGIQGLTDILPSREPLAAMQTKVALASALGKLRSLAVAIWMYIPSGKLT